MFLPLKPWELHGHRVGLHVPLHQVQDRPDAQMLSRGFKDQMYEVFRHLTQEAQVVVLWSATMPDNVFEVTRCQSLMHEAT
jgi:hypothetical protein